MRLAFSLSLWLSASVTIVSGAFGWLQLRVEKRDLEAAARRELILVATAVRSTVEYAVRDRQEPDVTGTLEELELRDPAMDIFVFSQEQAVLASSWGSSVNLSAARDLARESRAKDTLRIQALGSDRLAAIAPIRVRQSTVGRLVVVRPLDALSADIAAERKAAIAAIGGLIAVLCIVIALVVHLRVHQPMKPVMAAVRRISAGDLSARSNLEGRDEMSELAREIDTMASALESARERFAREEARREQMESDIQRVNKLAILGELAASLAHEIGSPLQVLNGRARALARQDELPPDARRSAEIIVEQTDRVTQIVDRLLGVARRNAPRLDDVDLRAPLNLVAELLASQARRMGVRLDVDVDVQGLPRVRADAAQVQQVLLNLLQNALRACTPGGTVRVALSRSSFSSPREGAGQPSAAVIVEDDGPGIPENLHTAIFEPFFTCWDDEQDRPGVGLGLSVVKSIVTEHGGAVIVATPESGVGTRFTVHFPVRSTSPDAGAEAV
jgi:signal transduction histidine kinase